MSCVSHFVCSDDCVFVVTDIFGFDCLRIEIHIVVPSWSIILLPIVYLAEI